ncbi:mechanosensitive ion channel [Candidatus Micrarchaeota archaeon]|nr:mechanosensitive ion channel [Candidatus Micrarchaeota archaeon]
MDGPIDVSALNGLKDLPGGEFTALIVSIAGLSIIFGILLKVLLKTSKYLVGKTATTLDDRIIHACESYLPVIAFITAVWISLQMAYPDFMLLGSYSVLDIYIIALLLVAGLFSSSIANAFLLWYGLELQPVKKGLREEDIYPFVRNVVKLSIVLLFLVFVLQRLGFDTTAIITGLGVGGLAVALALQDTLANFFAGVHILVDRPFQPGHYIKLDSGLEGNVRKIGWRTTRIMTLGQDEVVVPNSKIANATIQNCSSPNKKTGVLYELHIDYKEDLEKVEKTLLGILKKVSKENSSLDSKSIWARPDSFGEYSVKFKFGYLVKGYKNQFGLLTAVNKEIKETFKKKGITIPFPVAVRYETQKKAHKKE